MDIELGRGYVAFPRGLTDWEWYTEPNTARLYFHLLLTANWSRKQWQGITIQPGQLITSVAHLSAQTGMSIHQTRTALEHLSESGYVAIKTTPKYSVVTLIDYMHITGLDKLNGKPDGKPADTQPTNGWQAPGKQAATTLPSIPSEPEIPSSTSPDETTTPEHALVFKEYEANIGQLAPRCKAELADYAEQLGDEVACAVVHKCGDLGGHSWAYVRKALEDARSLGCKTAQDYQRRAPIGGSRAGGTRVERTQPPVSGNWMIENALHRRRLSQRKTDAGTAAAQPQAAKKLPLAGEP